jgi:hypothetical protein
MSFRDSINQSLAALDAPAGIDLVLDDTGALGISLASGLSVTIEVEEATGMLHLHGSLRRLPTDGTRTAVIEEALALNLFTRGTDGATLGLDRASDALILSVSRDITTLTHEDFAGLLTGFAEIAETLQTRFAEFGAPAPAPAAASTAGPAPFFADHADPRFLA